MGGKSKLPAAVDWGRAKVSEVANSINAALKTADESRAGLTNGLQEVLYSQDASRLENSLRKGRLLKIKALLNYDLLSKELRYANESEYLERFRRPEARLQLGLYKQLLQIVS